MASGFWSKSRVGKLSIRRIILWLVLALPAGGMLQGVFSGAADAHGLLHPTGEFGIRLMLLAMLIGPLIDIFGPNAFFRLWYRIRRNLGVAGFVYALLHLLFYCIDKGALGPIVQELTIASIWTGWLSFAAMLAAASISADWAVKKLGPMWKRIQMGVYAAFVLGIIHWWLLDGNFGPGTVHLVPLLVVWVLRIPMKNWRQRRNQAVSA